ncbi:glycoside hydrolase family 108 protein [Paracoccus shanxieyensis]|uniref:Acetylmuramidase n=1 Tax=Paracoccus shanxieyensis TaxID=2675752 RepID=A0A6L6J0Z0_9RHOB|nr:glycosyl hydrolase 108 family protein [Paracoccus shanxieyensis]MTH65082.1 acetylmuramidase [Paracoccus shanxieyensis]MTH88226.1 acetylmuramidase [Paracoccus shanxieyensis]
MTPAARGPFHEDEMRENREKVIAWIGMSEGGLVDHPKDPGGRTNKGITQKTYDAWLRSKKRQSRAVDHITKAEADQIVAEQYLDTVKFDDLPAGLDYSVGDFSVNSGPSRAVKELQKLVGTDQDGVMGARTLAAVARADLAALIRAYNDRRLAFLKSLRTWSTFGKGWAARVQSVRDRSMGMAAGRAAPVITVQKPGEGEKATDDQIRTTNLLGKVLEDPIALIPAVGTLVTPLASSNGPLSWALAGLILMAGAFVAIRALKRGV